MRTPLAKRNPCLFSDVRFASMCAAAIALLALALRLHQLGSESLWIDEGFSLRDSMRLDLAGEIRPLYFLFLREWLRLGMGRNEFLLRLPSALFGAAGVWVLFIVGRRLIGPAVALLASVFMAVSVLHVNHSQEVRMYSLTVLISLLSTYFLILFLERGSVWHVAGYLISAFAGLLTFPLTVFVLAAHGLFLLLYVRAYRPRSFVLLGVLLGTAVAWIPWLLDNMRAAAGYGEGYTATLDKPTLGGAVAFLGRFFLWKWSDPGRMWAAGAFGFSLMTLAIALYGLRGFRKEDAGCTLALLWLTVPIAGIATLSYGLTNMWMAHYLIAASPAFYLLVSKGIAGLGNRYLGGLAALVVISLTLCRLGLYYARPARPEWRTAVAYIQAHEQPGDVIGVYYGGNQHVFRYYYRGHAEWAPLGSDEYSAEDFGKWDDEKAQKLLSGFPLVGRRFWLVLSHHTFRGGFSIIGYIEKRCRVVDHRNYHLLEFYLFDEVDGLWSNQHRKQGG